jgi:predicted enzyme related to lactoylglutathione lyase
MFYIFIRPFGCRFQGGFVVTIGRLTLLVRDLDETKDFYANAFGFHTLFDGEVAPGFRAVHIGPGGLADTGLWLIKATSPDSAARVGAQTAGEPALVFYTDTLRDDLSRLQSMDVIPVKPVTTSPSGSLFAHIRDNNGNEIVLVELHEADDPDGAYRLTETEASLKRN